MKVLLQCCAVVTDRCHGCLPHLVADLFVVYIALASAAEEFDAAAASRIQGGLKHVDGITLHVGQTRV
jgi:hypothetical protein